MTRVLRQLLIHVHASTGPHHLNTRIKKVILGTTIRKNIKVFDDDPKLDILKVKIKKFLLIIKGNNLACIKGNNLACNAWPIYPHKLKRVSHYCRLRIVSGKSALNKYFCYFNTS
jgi:hypothetical protein